MSADEAETSIDYDCSRAACPVDEDGDGVGSLSPSPSLRTTLTSNTSIPSLQTGFSSACGSSSFRYHYKGALCDDLRSDVPTIAESIADMQDFQDLPPCPRSQSMISTHSHPADGTRTPRTSGSNRFEPISTIDSREHPLAVQFVEKSSMCSSTDSQFGTAAIGDLGSQSDVPSIRDDMSVTSAPSEICVSFPPSIYCSETGTITPNRERMKSLSGLRSSGSHSHTRSRGPSSDRTNNRGSRASKEDLERKKEKIKENPLLDLVVQGTATSRPRSPWPEEEASQAADMSAPGQLSSSASFASASEKNSKKAASRSGSLTPPLRR